LVISGKNANVYVAKKSGNMSGKAVNVLAVERFEMNNISGKAAFVKFVVVSEMNNMLGTAVNVFGAESFKTYNISGMAVNVLNVVKSEMNNIIGAIATVTIASVIYVERKKDTVLKEDVSALTVVRTSTSV